MNNSCPRRSILPPLIIAAFCLVVGAEAAAGQHCRSETLAGADYVLCSFEVAKTDLRLFWKDTAGIPYRTFDALKRAVGESGKRLVFAINGGMYDEDFTPIGLYIENGTELHAADTRTVTGKPSQIPNFYKKPNGVFYFGGGRAAVLETKQFLSRSPSARFATQSGPMLVIGGKIHPAFIPDSTDRKRRDGVCVASGHVHFALSESRVNFHDFAQLFIGELGCKDALFLDGGSAPGIFAPDLHRNDSPGHGGYGPIIAVIESR